MIYEVFQVLNDVYFYNKFNGFFIECGASVGVGSDCCCDKFEKYKNWKGINIEAKKDEYEQLLKYRPDCINLNYALCDKDNCEVTFYITSQIGNSSIEHSDKHLDELKMRNSTITETKVNAISWKKLIDVYNINKIDLLCLDIEGTEKYVLNDMFGSVIPDVICIEVGYEWGDKKELLKKLGYRFDFFHFNNAYCSKPNIFADSNKIGIYSQKEWTWVDHLIYEYEKDKF